MKKPAFCSLLICTLTPPQGGGVIQSWDRPGHVYSLQRLSGGIYCILIDCMLSRFSHVWLFATLWTVAHKTPLSMGFSRKECSGLPCTPPENLPNPGIEPASLMSPALSGRFFTAGATWEAHWLCWHNKIFPNHTESLFPNRNNSFFFWPCQEACRILAPPPGTEPGGHGSESAESWPLDHQGRPK